MPSMTIYISPIGTPLAGGGNSIVGHMYYTITDGNGTTHSYGFAPVEAGTVLGPGRVNTNDTTTYQSHQYQREIPISSSQFESVLAWSEVNKVSGAYGSYSGIGNNCITFAYDAMKAAGFNPTFTLPYHDWLPQWNGDNVDRIIYDYFRRAEFNREGRRGAGVDPTTNRNFQDAQNWIAPSDPLVLDLDGDGIEAVGINPAAPILFDMDGDGLKTATGWIKADDGMLVLDRNGNGLIDSGRELFGDSTILTRGPRAGQTAANGYEALADLDINGDGVINSLDAAYASLRIWQDANQDGISQASELRTLSSLGIASLNVTGQASNVNLGNGNTQPFSGSFTRTTGQADTAGAAAVAFICRSRMQSCKNRSIVNAFTKGNLK